MKGLRLRERQSVWRAILRKLFPFLALALAAGCSAAEAAPQRWTFCVAWQPGSNDVWITDVFAATIDRDKLEAELRSLLGRQVASRFVAQCPLPRADNTAV